MILNSMTEKIFKPNKNLLAYEGVSHSRTYGYMAKHGGIEGHSAKQVSFPIKILGYVLGWLDPDSVRTITARTRSIDTMINELKPKYIVEIGSGFSSRSNRFINSKFYDLDLPYFSGKNKNLISFEIGKDKLEIDVKEALFIVEGVTMYLQKKQVIDLLKQVLRYKGHLLIDFFNSEKSNRKKSIREKLYKLVFKLIIGRSYIFDFRIKNNAEGVSLLKSLGYKNVKFLEYNIPKTLDSLFYAKL